MVGAGVWAFIGVVVGGLLTIAGQATAELVKARVATRERQDRRDQLSREFQRETMIRLQAAMAEYRDALSRYGSQVVPTTQVDDQLSRARVGYQMLVHRVSSSSARTAVQVWEAAALRWFQPDDSGTASQEAEAWTTAMRLTSEAIRATD